MRELIVENNIEKRAVDLQPVPEAVHEKAHPRTSGSDHLSKALLADPPKLGLRSSFLAKA
jgi:hypothetical protein